MKRATQPSRSQRTRSRGVQPAAAGEDQGDRRVLQRDCRRMADFSGASGEFAKGLVIQPPAGMPVCILRKEPPLRKRALPVDTKQIANAKGSVSFPTPRIELRRVLVRSHADGRSSARRRDPGPAVRAWQDVARFVAGAWATFWQTLAPT